MNKGAVVVFFLGLLIVSIWVGFDNKAYYSFFSPEKAEAATSSGTSTLNVIIAPSITMTLMTTCDNSGSCDVDSTVDFGTVTAGTPNTGSIQVRSLSNDTVTMALGRKRATPATTLASGAVPSTFNISDTNGGIDVFTGLGTCAAFPWKSVSTGLGFTIFKADENKDTCWGSGTSRTDSNNTYAALQASSAASTAWTTTNSGTKYASIGLKLDVASTQRATSYTGDVVFTGTTTP